MGHTYTNLLFHVVFSTKERRAQIDDALRARLVPYLAGIAREEFGRALTIGGTENHLHALLSLRAEVSVAEALRKWKSLASGWVHRTFPDRRDFAWQVGYGAFAVSASNAARVTAYINGQAAHHRKVTFEEEFLALLKKHGVEYDPRHVWD